MSISFEAPAWLFLLPLWGGLAWVATRLRLPLSYTGRSVRWGFLRAYAPTLGFAAGLMLFTLALSRPILRWQAVQPRLSPTWVILDLSYSMGEADLPPSRRHFALALLNAWLDSLAERAVSAQLGLIVFAAQAYPVLPLTVDREAYRFALAEVGRLRMGEGSDLSAALMVLLSLAQPDENALLLSDGAHNLPSTPSIERVASALQGRGVRVHTVLVGRQGPQLYPEALEQVSRMTGGKAFVNHLPLTPLLETLPAQSEYALEPYLVLGAVGVGLLTLGAMAMGGWFSVLAP